ncbi:ABC transporter substrate-binding protein [Pseudodesulfovibrio cashew]|uniref:ABC transporter substrate-binding protein n=2 Tax=Pseudodesulfovibrio cashew TaxID=2678688 RepID=A0A6I6JI00_9BACT|nr:ABC transporter substrate-binding protein [Pseudodesulfovibrio cashew]
MITAKTGVAGKTNSLSFDAARFSVDKINSEGGILGRSVELLEFDNRSTPEGSAQAARQAIKDGVVAVVGCNWSSHSLAMADVLQKAGVPMVTHMSTNPAVTRVGDYIFRICYTDSFQGAGLASFARRRLRDKTAVVLVDESRTYSIGLADTFIRSFERLGGQILWKGVYHADSVPFAAIIGVVNRYEPDALFVPGGYEDVSGFFLEAKRTGHDYHLLSGDGVGMKLFDYVGRNVSGIYFSSHWSRWVNTELSRRFVKEYEQSVGKLKEDTSALVYDSFMLLKDAMERAGTVDKAKVRDALAATRGFKGITGTIRFDENGDPIKPMVINELRFGGIMFLEQIDP